MLNNVIKHRESMFFKCCNGTIVWLWIFEWLLVCL